jgi:hypothetical protein
MSQIYHFNSSVDTLEVSTFFAPLNKTTIVGTINTDNSKILFIPEGESISFTMNGRHLVHYSNIRVNGFTPISVANFNELIEEATQISSDDLLDFNANPSIGDSLVWDGTDWVEGSGGGGVSNGNKGDITVLGNDWTINNSVVGNQQLTNVSQNIIKGRVSSGMGVVEDLTDEQVRTLLNVEDGATAINELGDINNVSLTSPTNGQVLKFNGTIWVNASDSTGGGGGGYSYFPSGW